MLIERLPAPCDGLGMYNLCKRLISFLYGTINKFVEAPTNYFMSKLLSFCCLLFLVTVVRSQPVLLPVGGNAWILDNSNSLRIRNNGITRWQEDNTGFTAYIRVAQPGSLKVGLETDKLSAASQLWVSIAGDIKKITVHE